jgi:imidazole glycerol-phosphate synthase subunit HisH
VIALIDYGAGNLTSVRKGFAAAGAQVFTPSAPSDLARARAIVVPGVGHFGATRAIGDDWRRAIRDAVAAGRPLLGICLGLQWLFDGSEEAPDVRGLGAIRGTCARIDARLPLKVPHVGWNSLELRGNAPLLSGVEDGTHVYFTHSFTAPITTECAATTTHGAAFSAVVSAANVHGVQFHPEKSGPAGLRILRNFIAIATDAV